MLLSRNFTVDNNSDCHAITITEKRLKMSKMKGLLFYIIFKAVYFGMQNFNQMSIFFVRNQKTSIIRKNAFFQIIDSIRYGSRVSYSLSEFGPSLRPTLLAIGAVARPKASLWSGKIKQLHPFCGRRQ